MSIPLFLSPFRRLSGLFSRVLLGRRRLTNYRPAADCQIPSLADIYMKTFGLKSDGTFIEVGANDGASVSNTAFLADMGWTGIYVEPLPRLAARCRARHRRNNVKVIEAAVGSTRDEIRVFDNGLLSSAVPAVNELYQKLDWSRPLLTNDSMLVKQKLLEDVLAENRIPPEFDILGIDVEGMEWEVLRPFDLARWRPRLLICELEDQHPSFQGASEAEAKMREDARKCREKVLRTGLYEEIYRDQINTVYRLLPKPHTQV